MREEQARTGVDDTKNVLLLLTDGEDTSSEAPAETVLRALAAPGVPNFMFVLVAVEMNEREERVFEPWVAMRHCKQLSVSVRTGARLVKIFKEGVMNRVLLSEANSARFLNAPASVENDAASAAPGDVDLSGGGRAHAVEQLTGMLEDSLPTPWLSASLLRGLERNHSANVSRANSESGSDGPEERDMLLERDFDLSPQLSPPHSPMGSSPHSPMGSSRWGFRDFDESSTFQASGTDGSSPPRRLPTPPPRAMAEHEFEHLSGLVVDEISNGGQYLRPPHECICPISQEIMADPVVCADGHTYDRRGIEQWFASGKRTSPLTGAVLSSLSLIPNHALRSLIQSQSQSSHPTLDHPSTSNPFD